MFTVSLTVDTKYNKFKPNFTALKKGGRWPYLVLATLLHGFTVECVSYFVPDIDNFWQAQSPIIFVGRRLPLYITVLCK